MAAPVTYQAAYLPDNRPSDREKRYKVQRQKAETYINMRRATMRANGEGKLYYVLRREIRLEWLTMSCEQKQMFETSLQQKKLASGETAVKPWMLPVYPTERMRPALRKELESAPACLFTFNNGWLMDQADWCALVRELKTAQLNWR